jgi:hypothetical protein
MVDKSFVNRWLDLYVQAWKSYDPRAIGNLFSEDAQYYYGPYREPVRGRESIIANWLENRDQPGTYDATYNCLATDGDLAVSNGRSTYYESDGSTLKTQYDNIFVLNFDAEGRCKRFCEWFMEKPKKQV